MMKILKILAIASFWMTITTPTWSAEQGKQTIYNNRYQVEGYTNRGRIYDRSYKVRGYYGNGKIYDRSYRVKGYYKGDNQGNYGGGKGSKSGRSK